MHRPIGCGSQNGATTITSESPLFHLTIIDILTTCVALRIGGIDRIRKKAAWPLGHTTCLKRFASA